MAATDLPRLLEAHLAQAAGDLPFWERLARRCGPEVLELGCGTGRVVRALARLGAKVTGIDHDPQVLSFAATSLSAELRPQVHFLEADMRTLALDRSFDLIVATCNTLASLDDDGMRRSLHQAYQHLRPGGLFAAELPAPQEVQDDTAGEILSTFVEPVSGNPVQVSARQTAVSPRGPLDVEWRYDELLPDGRVERSSFSTTYHLRQADGILQILAEAGFAEIELLGDYDEVAWSPGAARMLVLARRPRE
jgi:SAM-dependent methyltransferase